MSIPVLKTTCFQVVAPALFLSLLQLSLYRSTQLTMHLLLASIRLLLFCILFFFTVPVGISQQVNEDSLLKIIAKNQNDTGQVRAMRKLASYYILHKNDDTAGLAMLDKAATLSEKINFALGNCEVLLTKGNYYFKKENWIKAVETFTELSNKALLIPDKDRSTRTQMIALNNLAGIFTNNGDYPTATEYYLKSRQLLETIAPEDNALSIVYINLASIYIQQNEFAKAKDNLQKCKQHLQRASPSQRIIYWFTLYDYADKTADKLLVQQSIDSFDVFVKNTKLSPAQLTEASITKNEMKGNYSLKYKKNAKEALAYYLTKYEAAIEADDRVEIHNSNYQIATVYKELGEKQKAISYLQTAFSGAEQDNVKQVSYLSSLLLSFLYHTSGDEKNAYKFSEIARNLNDSTNSQAKVNYNNLTEARYQNTKKEKEISELILANTQKELAVAKRNRLLIGGGILAAALLIILGLLYRNSKQKQALTQKENTLQQEQIKFLEKQQQVVSLQSMVNGQETERTRIAKDLHDGLGGLFSTVKMYFSTLQHEQASLKSNSIFTKSYELIDTASEEVRRIAHNMMPEVLMKLGLLPAVQDMCSNISAGKLLQVSLQSYGMEKRLNASTEIMLYRILQELLNNIIKHAQATEAIVQFNREANRLVVTVEDNGRGFNTLVTDNKTHAGLETIKSRVTYLNGNISIDSQQEVGTTIMMEFLLNDEA
jgi:signal transduction histidine kinase